MVITSLNNTFNITSWVPNSTSIALNHTNLGIVQSTLPSNRDYRSLPEFPDWYVPMLLIACIVIIVPNIGLLIALFKIKVLRKQAPNQFIISFAISDLLTGFILFPLGIIHEVEYVQRYRYETAMRNKRLQMFREFKEKHAAHHGISFPYFNYTDMEYYFQNEDTLPRTPYDDLGSTFCDLLMFVMNYISYISIWHMSIIAMDRYLRITSPITYKRWMTRSRAWYCSITIWVAALPATCLFFWFYKTNGYEYEPSQCMFYPKISIYAVCFGMIICFVPIFFTFYFYTKLIIISRYTFKSNQPIEVYLPRRHGQDACIPMTAMRPMVCFMRRPNSSSSDSEDYDEIEDDSRSSRTQAEMMEIRARSKRCRRSKRASILVGFIIGGHMIFVFPCTFFYFCYTYFPELEVHKSTFIYFYPWMTFFNSAYNPLIYFLLTKDLRHCVFQWIRRKFRFCCDTNP